jgi:hypothetical protein
MWRLLKTSLDYYRKALTISWSIAIGSTLLILALVAFLDDSDDPVLFGQVGTTLAVAVLIGSMIAAFIITGTEKEEKRLALLVTMPLSLREIALHRAVLPVAAVALGAALSAVLILVGALLVRPVFSTLSAARLYVAVKVAGEALFLAQIPLAIRDIVERFSTGRRPEAFGTLVIVNVLIAATFAHPSYDIVEPVRLALVWLAGAAMFGLNVAFFQRRDSFR